MFTFAVPAQAPSNGEKPQLTTQVGQPPWMETMAEVQSGGLSQATAGQLLELPLLLLPLLLPLLPLVLALLVLAPLLSAPRVELGVGVLPELELPPRLGAAVVDGATLELAALNAVEAALLPALVALPLAGGAAAAS